MPIPIIPVEVTWKAVVVEFACRVSTTYNKGMVEASEVLADTVRIPKGEVVPIAILPAPAGAMAFVSPVVVAKWSEPPPDPL